MMGLAGEALGQTIGAIMPPWLLAAAGAVIAALLYGWRQRRAGASGQRQQTALEAAEAQATAFRNRERIEDAIDQDVDLAGRARRAGVVRQAER